MRTMLRAVCLGLVLLSSQAVAATLTWDRNSEADMKEYHVYFCQPGPTCTVVATAATRVGTVPQPAVGASPSFVIPAAWTVGKAAVTAVDLSGNESVLSMAIPFDSKAPVAPLNLRLQ